MINPDRLKRLIDLASAPCVAELEVNQDDFRLKITMDQTVAAPIESSSKTVSADLRYNPDEERFPLHAHSGFDIVFPSPLYGLFHATASPDQRVFVDLLAHVSEGDTLGMVESMKLQHPVTKLTSGLGLVPERIRVAQGEPLRLKQKKYPVHSHSTECRLNAEDPETFEPCPGTISLWQIPDYSWLRIDTRLHSGHTVPSYYDFFIAKVITYGSDRDQALARMKKALGEILIEGVKTNLPLLLNLVRDSAVQRGSVDIHFTQNRSIET